MGDPLIREVWKRDFAFRAERRLCCAGFILPPLFLQSVAHNSPFHYWWNGLSICCLLNLRIRAGLEVIAKLLGEGRGAQLAQRLGLDLAHPLAGHAQLFANLLQRILMPVAQAKA
jgi:hypothetical protein